MCACACALLSRSGARHHLKASRHPRGFLLYANHLSGHRRLRLRVFDLACERGKRVILAIAVWLTSRTVATRREGAPTVSGMEDRPTSLRRLLDALDAGDQVSDRTGDGRVLRLERPRDLSNHTATIPAVSSNRDIRLAGRGGIGSGLAVGVGPIYRVTVSIQGAHLTMTERALSGATQVLFEISHVQGWLSTVPFWRLAHVGGWSKRRFIRCPGIGWAVRVAAVWAKGAQSGDVMSGGESVLIGGEWLALDAASGAKRCRADVLVGSDLLTSDEALVERRAIGDTEVMPMRRHMQVRVRMPVGYAIVAAVVVIHDMIVGVRCPVEMLVGAALAGFAVVAWVVVLARMVVGVGHMRDRASGRGSHHRASGGTGLDSDVIVRLFVVAIYIKGLIHPVASCVFTRRWASGRALVC